MGLLIDGVWQDDSQDKTRFQGGKYVRATTRYRKWVTPDGSAGPSGEAGFKAEPGRYHLYVALSCPWAHRTLIYRAVKRLEGAISVSVAVPGIRTQGWTFGQSADYPESTPDQVNGFTYLHQAYT